MTLSVSIPAYPRPSCLALVLLVLSTGFLAIECLAQDEKYFVRDFRVIDEEYLAQAAENINNRLSAHTGTRFRGNPAYDLPLLQRLLDEEIVQPSETQLLQAMGVIFGEAMRSQYPLDWIRYEDARGTSRALQFRHNAHFIFPITAISRRTSAGLDVNVQALYQKLLDPVVEAYQR